MTHLAEAGSKNRDSDFGTQRETVVLSQENFLRLIKAVGSDFYPPDDEQAEAVFSDPRTDLFIVAGPGTGKTSCLSFRALYLIFVAGFAPRSIMATTFTKKAAAELRSRLLGWGYRLIDAASKIDLPPSTLESLKAIDLNQILTGTIDGLAENSLYTHTHLAKKVSQGGVAKLRYIFPIWPPRPRLHRR